MSKKKPAKLTTPRNTIAIKAKFRNSAGSMKSKKVEEPIENCEEMHCNNGPHCLMGKNIDDMDCGCWCECDICWGS